MKVESPALERARHTALADMSADAGVTDSATPRRAPAFGGTPALETQRAPSRHESRCITAVQRNFFRADHRISREVFPGRSPRAPSAQCSLKIIRMPQEYNANFSSEYPIFAFASTGPRLSFDSREVAAQATPRAVFTYLWRAPASRSAPLPVQSSVIGPSR